MTAIVQEELNVLFPVSGVFFKILFLVELGGIYKNAAYRKMAILQAFPYKRHMPFMKRAHGRYETDFMPVIPFKLKAGLKNPDIFK